MGDCGAVRFVLMRLEWVADREVEGGISLVVGVNERPFFLSVGRVVSFHSHVESEQEIVEVESESYAIGCGELLVELAKLELAARLVLVFANSPDVAGIDESSQFDYPEKFGPEFDVGVEPYVAALINEFGL